MLCALSSQGKYHLHIRSFKDGRVQSHALDAGDSLKVEVQHGDVIATSCTEECPSFLKEQMHCAGLPERERFERLKSFCYAAKDSWVDFYCHCAKR